MQFTHLNKSLSQPFEKGLFEYSYDSFQHFIDGKYRESIGEISSAIGGITDPLTLGAGRKLGDEAGRVETGSIQYGSKEDITEKVEILRDSGRFTGDFIVSSVTTPLLMKGISKGKDVYTNYKLNNSFSRNSYNGVRNPDIDFLNAKGKSTLITHATKHGYTSSEKYLKDARNFLEKNPTSTTQFFVSDEGTYFRYDTATNEFGIINKYGGISTYYKPENGELYWLEQIEKYAPK